MSGPKQHYDAEGNVLGKENINIGLGFNLKKNKIKSLKENVFCSGQGRMDVFTVVNNVNRDCIY